jgi:hypothetical protein
MFKGKKFLAIALCVCLFGLLTPAYAGDRDVAVEDLKGIPKKHRFLTSVVGGALVGAGIGALLPGGGDTMLKGMLIGSGSAGEWYMARNRRAASGWRDWAHIGSTAALGTGIGWTVCNCNDGAFAGMLIGGGLQGIWQSSRTSSPTVATTTTNPPRR